MARLSSIFVSIAAAVSLVSCGGASQDAAEQKEAPRFLASSTYVAADYTATVQQLYVAYFGRPADPGALQHWSAALAGVCLQPGIDSLNLNYRTNPTVKAMVDIFATSEESAALYPSGTTTVNFLNSVYLHVLGRNADLGGLLFWADAVDGGSLTRQQAAMSIMAGALANSSDQGRTDALLVNNRVAVAAAFTEALVAKGKTAYYAGTSSATDARLMLDSVSGTFDPAGIPSFVDCYVSAMGAVQTGSSGSAAAGALVAQPAVVCPSGLVTIAGAAVPAQ